MDAAARASVILSHWANAIAQRDLDGIAKLFAADAVFVATGPSPLIGRAAVREYYATAPAGLQVTARLDVAVAQADGLAMVADVVFHIPDRAALAGRLSLCCGQGDAVRLYHLSLAN